MYSRVVLTYFFVTIIISGRQCVENVTTDYPQIDNALAKLVKMFSKPGAFKRIDTIFEENLLETSTTCPQGDEGLECRRAEARRSVDCPGGDCFCHNCSAAGPELWSSCCRGSSRCCSHLAAACRNCDQPTLYQFCAKNFKKCLSQLNEKQTNLLDNSTTDWFSLHTY
ncbi:uncharacterized protein LOC117176751 [Belonocnema kinseyi]|uniref:uncharacterized protein LOC117176751 n=1 Tax=Belonocnema kinseyi TaxID=2817044 RepID=UPI00143D71F2|nr:uncharacterized protein LOC117176751 [Belonocnema kinseyi]